MGWRFAPLPGGHGFGAEAQEVVSPEQLSALDNAARDELAEALDEHALVVIRLSERAEPAQLAAFAKGMWGSCVDFSQTPADAASGTGRPCSAPGVPEVRVLGNTTDSGAPDSLLCRIGYEWHSDGDGPGVYSVLHCHSTPMAGGDTLFTDMAAAYRSLTDDQRRFADSATAIHSNLHTGGGPAAVDAECGLRMDASGTIRIRPAHRRKATWRLGESRFPIVQRHPSRGPVLVGGGKNLESIEGFSPEESARLCSELLLAHVRPSALSPLDASDLLPTGETAFSPDAVLRLRWSPGQLVVWDNLALVHSTTPVALFGPGERRFLHVIATDVRRLGAQAGGGGGGGDYTDAAAPAEELAQ